MSFKLIVKGSTVQENLLPGTGKEMATMYDCNSFKDCTLLQAKHYCAKQNQPELILDSANTVGNFVAMQCDMDTELCSSDESHVHVITHEISEDNSQLKSHERSSPNHRLNVRRAFSSGRKSMTDWTGFPPCP
jgi:hypothetical protein